MPSSSLASVLRHLRRTAGHVAGLDDAALLERFIIDRDEAAFELLVWRHGPMVLGVCRRRLRDIHAAEDAFQATFLALARRAKSIRRQASVAGWLYRVAGRMALAARQKPVRQIEQPLDEMTPGREPEPADVAALRELRQTLDDAVARLPARYREPLVLTCFAGRSHAEAARELGCAVRTIESRLGRARQKLRTILLRRGLLPAGGLAAALAPAEAPAHVATSLIVATVRAAGQGPASVAIETLTQGVLHAMLLSKIKIAGAVVFAAGFVGLGTGGWVYQSRVFGQVPGGEPQVIPVPVQSRPEAPPPSPPPTVVAPQPAPPPPAFRSQPVSKKEERQDRLRALLHQLNEEMADTDPGDTFIAYLEGVLKAQRDERARLERDDLVAQHLRTIDEAVKKLKVIATNDPGQTMVVPVEGFEGDVRRFKQSLHATGFATEANPIAPRPNPPPSDPNILNFNWNSSTDLGTVGTITRRPPTMMKIMDIKLTRQNGVDEGQVVKVARGASTPELVGFVRIIDVKGENAVARIIELRKGKSVEVGDRIVDANAAPAGKVP